MRWFVHELASWLGEVERAPLSECVLSFCEEGPNKESMVGSFCALLELITLGVVTVEPGGEDALADPIVCLREGVKGDVSELLDAVRFDDEATSEEEGDVSVEPEPLEEGPSPA